MTTDKVVTPLQPSQRDHLDSFNALSTKRILVDPKAVRRQPSIDRNNMGEDTMSNKKCTGSGSGSGASFDSGSDSDSSEDLQYGPGFVSKLKSRYMSAAFKSSATSGLRRTASLEDFLDKDKEEVSIELNQPRMTKFQKKNNEDLRPSRRTGGVAAHVNKKSRESIKRCQSVEVLSRNRIEEPSSSPPPPLPPKNTTQQHHLDGVLNSEALANNNLVIERLPTPAQSLKNVKSKTGFSSSSSSTSSNSSPTVIASLRGPFHYRRRSALLFGINEVELPAPDTVKETRKIFETGNSHRGLQTMVKSKSTSNLIYGQRRKSSSSPVRSSSSKTTTRQNSSQPKFHLVTAKPALPAKPDKVDLKKKTPTRPTPMIKSLDHGGGLQAKHSSKADQAIEIEEGIKIVSKDSINKIRSSGESFSFNFHKKTEEKSSCKPGYLPKAKAASENSDKVPVGVIKPITRNAKETSRLNKTVQQAPDATSLNSSSISKPEQKLQKTVPPTVQAPPPTLSSTLSQPKQQRAESPTTTLNNLINLTKQTKNNETTGSSEKENRKKEVVILPDKSILKSNNKSHKVVTFAQDNLKKSKSKVDNSASSTTDEGIDKDIAVAELESNIDTVMKCNNNKVDNRESSWKTKTESKNTIVFNFLNSQKDVTHIENDGLDLSKRKKKQQLAKESGVVILRNSLNTSTQDEDEDEGVDEVDSDSDSGLGGSVPPCSVTFIGANVSTGKSSMRLSKPRDFKKRNITFSESLTQVFEYPSSDSSVTDQPSADTSTTGKLGITSSKNALGSFGGLGSYTPSKMKDANSFQLGVSRTVPHSTSTTSEKTTTSSSSNGNEKPKEEVLRPIEDAISWSGSSSSSDMLF